MQKITPCLWFDTQAEEAMNIFTSSFPNSRIVIIQRYPDEPLAIPISGMEGKVLTGIFELAGQQFMALDGGPMFRFNPSVSFFVNCETEAEIDELWQRFADGGKTLMALQQYPFSEKFGWLEDKYGLSWQLNLAPRPQKITPFLMFAGEQHGKAEEAIRFYTALFENAGIVSIEHYAPGEYGDPGTVKHAVFRLAGQEFMAIDSNLEHDFTFNEAISFHVECKSSDELDYLWDNLSVDPAAEQCGWLRDKYGVSWQIIPALLPQLLNDPDPEKSRRVMDAMLQMKKIDVEGLQKAYAG